MGSAMSWGLWHWEGALRFPWFWYPLGLPPAKKMEIQWLRFFMSKVSRFFIHPNMVFRNFVGFSLPWNDEFFWESIIQVYNYVYIYIYIYMFQTLKWEMYRILPILFLYVYRHICSICSIEIKDESTSKNPPTRLWDSNQLAQVPWGWGKTRPAIVATANVKPWHAMNHWILVGGFLGSLAFMVPMIIPSYMTV